MWLRACLGAAALLLVLAGPRAAASAGGLGAHLALNVSRPLHARLEQSDAVALGTVERVDAGRIRIRDSLTLAGTVPAGFEVKRSASNPPPLEVGDRALLLLRGARPPYLLVDDPKETIRVSGPESEARWRQLVHDLGAAGQDRERLSAAYAGWIDGPDDDLHALAVRTLSTSAELSQALSPSAIEACVRIATDPDAARETRRGAAFVALTREEGLRGLFARLPGAADDADPEIVLAALQYGLARDPGGAADLFHRSLEHGSPEIRRAALEVGAMYLNAPKARAAVECVAENDPAPDVKSAATRLLRR